MYVNMMLVKMTMPIMRHVMLRPTKSKVQKMKMMNQILVLARRKKLPMLMKMVRTMMASRSHNKKRKNLVPMATKASLKSLM